MPHATFTRRRALALGIPAALGAAAGGAYAYRRWRRRARTAEAPELPPTKIAERSLGDPSAPLRAPAEDWPRWLGPRGDGISRESGLATSWPAGGPRRLWSADVGLGHASPVAAGGRVYLFTRYGGWEALSAFDARTGRLLWNDEADCPWSGSHPGTRASPVLDGGRAYTFGAAGDLICRRLGDGRPVWRLNLLAALPAENLPFGTASNPLIADDLIYVQGGKAGPACVAVRKATGEVAWRSEAAGGAGYAPPVLIDVDGVRLLIVLAKGMVWAIDPLTGRTRWGTPWANGDNSSPPVYADGHLFVTGVEGPGSAIFRLSASGAALAWQSRTVEGKFQAPVLDAGHLYLNGVGTIRCLRFPSGETAWAASDPRLRINPGGSMVRVEGDKLLLMSARGRLSLARATPGGIELLAQAQVFEGTEVFATPLLYGGRLYAKGMQEVACFDLTSAGPGTPPSSRPAPAP